MNKQDKIKVTTDAEKQGKLRPTVDYSSNNQIGLTKSPTFSVTNESNGSIEDQVAYLSDLRLSTVQRQTLVDQIGYIQSNSHISKVVNLVQQNRSHGHQYEASALSQTPDIQRQSLAPATVSHDVALIPQPTAVSCWAASLDMVVSYRDQKSYSVRDIAAAANMNLNSGYEWSDILRAITAWGLQAQAPMSAEPPWWIALLEAKGPLWIVEMGAPYHAVVVGGIHGDSTPGATQVKVYNPWPPNQGAIEYKTFEDFDKEFGLGAGSGAMIVHA